MSALTGPALADPRRHDKKASDTEGIWDYVWTMIGNDTRGGQTYMAGKVV